MLSLHQEPGLVEAGRVKAVFWPGHERLAGALARAADQAVRWPGLSGEFRDSITILLAPGQQVFDSLTQDRLPEWGVAAAFPGSMTIVLNAAARPMDVLPHELAHLALHSHIRHTPVWFSEGYAVWAAGEWNRLETLRVNLALVMGRVPTLSDLSRQLREGRSRAGAAYALASTAISSLERIGGPAGMKRLLAAYEETLDLDAALRATYLTTLDQFEASWRREIRRRYGWLSLLTSFTVFWLLVGSAVGALWWKRRRRDRLRRAGLDEGWEITEEEWRNG